VVHQWGAGHTVVYAEHQNWLKYGEMLAISGGLSA